MNKKLLISITALVFLGLGGYFGYKYWVKGTPEYSFLQMKTALKNHDTIAFNRYFDAETISNNIWPRMRPKYSNYYSAQSSSVLSQSITQTKLDNQEKAFKEAFKNSIYEIVTGKLAGATNVNSEIKTGYFAAFLNSEPIFKMGTNGVVSTELIHQNYASQNPQNYPVYKIVFIFEQQKDRHWKIIDEQGVEDIFASEIIDNTRIKDLETIGGIVNQYLTETKITILNKDNWREALNNYYREKNQTTSVPEDPLSSYGNKYEFAITNADSLKSYSYIIKANLSTVNYDVFQRPIFNGLNFVEIINRLSEGKNMILGIDCTPPALCFPGWGNESNWYKLLSTDIPPPTTPESTTSPTPIEAPKTWHTVTTISAQVDTKTAPFTMRGNQWRIIYKCVSGSKFNSFSGNIESVKKGYGPLFANGVECPKDNTSYEYAQSPGQYYLNLRLLDAFVTVTIEDYY